MSGSCGCCSPRVYLYRFPSWRFETTPHPPLLGTGEGAIPRDGDWVYVYENQDIDSFFDYRRVSYGILADGSLWAWGYGVFGNGEFISLSSIPRKVSSDRWASVASHGTETFAVKEDGTLWHWGLSANSGNGNPGPVGETVFKPLRISSEITAISLFESVVDALVRNREASSSNNGIRFEGFSIHDSRRLPVECETPASFESDFYFYITRFIQQSLLPGSGYTSTPDFIVSTADGSSHIPASFSVEMLFDIVSVDVVSQGSGYDAADTVVVFNEPPAPGFPAPRTRCVVEEGRLVSVELLVPSTLRRVPSLRVAGRGSGAEVVASVSGRVDTVSLLSGGMYYTTTNVIFEFVGGNPTAPATFSGIMRFRRHLTYVSPVIRGSGYTIDDSSGRDGLVYLNIVTRNLSFSNAIPVEERIGQCLLSGSSVVDERLTVDVNWDTAGGGFYSARTFLNLRPTIPKRNYEITSPIPAAWLLFEGGVPPVSLTVFSTLDIYGKTVWNATLPEGVSGCFGNVSLRVDWSAYETSSYEGQPPPIPAETWPAIMYEQQRAFPSSGAVEIPGGFVYVPGRVEFYAATGCWSVVEATEAYTILAYSPAPDGNVYWGVRSSPNASVSPLVTYYPEWLSYASVPASSGISPVGYVDASVQWNPWVLHNPHAANGLSVVLEDFSPKEGHSATYTATIRVEDKGGGFTTSPKICMTPSRFLPQQVGNDSDWTQVAMTNGSSNVAAIGLKSDGTLWVIRGALGPYRQGYSLRLFTNNLQSNYGSVQHGSPLGVQTTQIYNTPDVVDQLMPHTYGGFITTEQIDPYYNQSLGGFRTHAGRRPSWLESSGGTWGSYYINSVDGQPTMITRDEAQNQIRSLPKWHSPSPPYVPSLVFPVRGPNTDATDAVCYTFAPSDLPHGLIAAINSPEPCLSLFREGGAVYAISEATGAAWHIAGPLPPFSVPEEIAPPIATVPLFVLSPGLPTTSITWNIEDKKGDTTIVSYPNWQNYSSPEERLETAACMNVEFEWSFPNPNPLINQTLTNSEWLYTGISVEVPGRMTPVVISGGEGYIDRDDNQIEATYVAFGLSTVVDSGIQYRPPRYSIGTKGVVEKTGVSVPVFWENGGQLYVSGQGGLEFSSAIGPPFTYWGQWLGYGWPDEPDKCPSGKGDPVYYDSIFLSYLEWADDYIVQMPTSHPSNSSFFSPSGNVRDGVIIGCPGQSLIASSRATPGSIYLNDGIGEGGVAVWMRALGRSGPFSMQGRHTSLTGNRITSASATAFVSGGRVYETQYQDIPVPVSAAPPVAIMRSAIGLTPSGKAYFREHEAPDQRLLSYWFSIHNIELRLTDAGSRLTAPTLIGLDQQPSSSVAVAEATIDGRVTSVGVDDGGTGYTSSPSVHFDPEGAEAFAIIEGPVSSLTVINPGFGYTQPPLIRFSGRGYGAAASAVISEGMVTGATVTSGGVYAMPPDISVEPRKEVVSISLDNGGSGYSTLPKVVIVGGCDGEPARASCQISASVTSVLVSQRGEGFSPDDPPQVFFSGGGGSGAAATVVIDPEDGSVQSVLVTNGGDGYTSPPSVTFSEDTISATATIAGRVSSLMLHYAGTDYVSAPAVLFVGGGGHGAGATATIGGRGGGAVVSPILSGKVIAVRVTDGGSGYQYPPRVLLSGGGGSGASCQSRIKGPLVDIEVVHGGDFYAAEGRGVSARSPSSQSGKRISPTADIVDVFNDRRSPDTRVGTATFESDDNGPITALKSFEIWDGRNEGFGSKPEIRFSNGFYVDAVFAPKLSPSSVGVVSNAPRIDFPKRDGRLYRWHTIRGTRFLERNFSSELVLGEIGGMALAESFDFSMVTAMGISLTQLPFAHIDFDIVDASGNGAVVSSLLSQAGTLISASISSGGSGYTSRSVLQIRSASLLQQPCVATCEVSEDGRVERVIVQDGGRGYFSPVAVVHGGGGTGCVVETVSGIAPSGVLAIVVTNGGEGYSQENPPAVFVYESSSSLYGSGLFDQFNESLASFPCISYESGVPYFVTLGDDGERTSVVPGPLKADIPSDVHESGYEDWFAIGQEISDLRVVRSLVTPSYQQLPAVVVSCRADRPPVVEASLVRWSPVSNSDGVAAGLKRDTSL